MLISVSKTTTFRFFLLFATSIITTLATIARSAAFSAAGILHHRDGSAVLAQLFSFPPPPLSSRCSTS